jgi:hypothetical protein
MISKLRKGLIGVVLAGAASIFSGCTTDPNYWNTPRAAQDMNLLSFITGMGAFNASSAQQARALAISSEVMGRESTRLSIENSRSNPGNDSISQRESSVSYSGDQLYSETLTCDGVSGDLNHNGMYDKSELDMPLSDKKPIFVGAKKEGSPYAYVINLWNIPDGATTLTLEGQTSVGGPFQKFHSWNLAGKKNAGYYSRGHLNVEDAGEWHTRWILEVNGKNYKVGENHLEVIHGGFVPKR